MGQHIRPKSPIRAIVAEVPSLAHLFDCESDGKRPTPTGVTIASIILCVSTRWDFPSSVNCRVAMLSLKRNRQRSINTHRCRNENDAREPMA